MLKFIVITPIFITICILISKSDPKNMNVWMISLLIFQTAFYSIWEYVVKRKKVTKQLN